MPLATPRVSLHDRRSHRSARARSTPFNLKSGGRGPSLSLAAPSERSPVGWVGPWVALGHPAPAPALGRLALYELNQWSLWVMGPARAGWGQSSLTWLGTALRGLTGRVALKLRFKGKSFR